MKSEMTESKKLIGILGGTFDPIHFGHLNIAETLFSVLPFSEIQFIPCGQPPHREKPYASPIDRFNMVKLAIASQIHFYANDIEIKKTTPSYTIETLQALRPIFPEKNLCLILSTETFSKFNLWHKWEKILNYCHLLVINRPSYSLPETSWLKNWLSQHQTKDFQELSATTHGKILFYSIKEIPCSATEIRRKLIENNYIALTNILPKNVIEYIKKHHLYQ